MEEPIDLYNANLAAEQVLKRDLIASKANVMATENLLIAQHRDTLRYAQLKGGGLSGANLRNFEVGDYVYLRRRQLDSTLQLLAKPEIFRVKEVFPNGVVVLQGKCGSCMTNNVVN